jgi:hypothetical protein
VVGRKRVGLIVWPKICEWGGIKKGPIVNKAIDPGKKTAPRVAGLVQRRGCSTATNARIGDSGEDRHAPEDDLTRARPDLTTTSRDRAGNTCEGSGGNKEVAGNNR